MKRIVTVQDVSCVGKCSLTVALPIISAFGIETAVLPTAVLSTHTAFSSFTFKDLTDELPKIIDEWEKQKLGFDCIYTGYLGSKTQLDIVSDLIKKFKKENSFVLIDPVMADNGKLYKGFNQEFADDMAKHCGKADIIVPNLTEASFMLHSNYKENYDEKYIKDTLNNLVNLGAKTAVLTGVSFDKNLLGVYALDKKSGKFYSYYREKLPVSFHGTGDVFASALCGALTLNKPIQSALEIAVDYTVECIKITMENKERNWYGVDFESAIPYLVKRIK